MTAPDNQLTKDATNSGGASFPSNDACVFVDALVRLGYRADGLMAAAGLSKSVLEDPDARIPCEKFGAFIGYAMRTRPTTNLGVKIATQTSIGAFPLLDYLVISSDSVGHGLSQLARYFRLVGTPTEIEIREDEDPVRVVIWDRNISLSSEFCVALTAMHLRAETEGKFRPEYVAFAHKPDDPAEIEKILDCKVKAEASWTGLAIGREGWLLPFRRRDPVLRGLLKKQADETIARLPAVEGLPFDVRRVLARRIAGGDTRIDAVAKELATTPRTLQRKLAAEGLSYQSLVELARKEAVEKYLSDRSLSIAEISYLLGYSEPSALHRAFKRWKGTTPQAFRQSRYLGSNAGRAAQAEITP
jgi:AraC-like DNA-binding protein